MRRPNSGNPSSASLSGLMTPKMKKLARATNTELRLNALRRVRNFRDSSSAKYTVAHLNLTVELYEPVRKTPGKCMGNVSNLLICLESGIFRGGVIRLQAGAGVA